MRHCLTAPILTFILLATSAGAVDAQTIIWLDWEAYPIPGSGTVIAHPLLGDVQVTTTFEPQARYARPSGSLGSLSWDTAGYINYDASSTGTNSPIFATMTFTFLDGPIDLSTTRVFFSSDGLALGSRYTVDGVPVFLGTIGTADGPGTYTPIGQQLLIEGVGSNHDPDLIELTSDPLSSITVDVQQIEGDGVGLSIGAASTATSVPALSLGGSALLAALLAATGGPATRLVSRSPSRLRRGTASARSS